MLTTAVSKSELLLLLLLMLLLMLLLFPDHARTEFTRPLRCSAVQWSRPSVRVSDGHGHPSLHEAT